VQASSKALVAILILVCIQTLSGMVNAQSTASATISGTIRCGSGCSVIGLKYGDPIQSGGSVIAHMTVALDPFTGVVSPDLTTTDSNTTFGASDHGRYELHVFPGIFDLYVLADGYQFALFASGVTVKSGQNVTLDAYVTPGVATYYGPLSITTFTAVTSTTTTTVAPVIIPGFPVESLLLGLLLGLCALALLRRMRKRVMESHD